MSPPSEVKWRRRKTPIKKGRVLRSTAETIVLNFKTSFEPKVQPLDIAHDMAFQPVAARTYTPEASVLCTGDDMEIRDDAATVDSRSFRDSLKAWKDKDTLGDADANEDSVADEARAEGEGMVLDVAQPEFINEPALDTDEPLVLESVEVDSPAPKKR